MQQIFVGLDPETTNQIKQIEILIQKSKLYSIILNSVRIEWA